LSSGSGSGESKKGAERWQHPTAQRGNPETPFPPRDWIAEKVANLERGGRLERVEPIFWQGNSGGPSPQAQAARKPRRGRVPRKTRLPEEKIP
jgi:hypothetical protein